MATKTFLHAYERELAYLRKLGLEFSRTHPKVADQLQLTAGKSPDPHVERLIQAFAFLAARIHLKLEDSLPEFSDSLLSILYPHFLAPIPSLSILQFVVDPKKGKLTTSQVIDPGSVVYSHPVEGTRCRFRTCYPTTLWPIEVQSARLEPADNIPPGIKASAVLRIKLGCQGKVVFSGLEELSSLRFYLHGESFLTHTLYELLLNNVTTIQLSPGARIKGVTPVFINPESLQPVGFSPEESLLPYPPQSFLGYRLLQEYFIFPEKFFFIDLSNLEKAGQAGFLDSMEVAIYLDRSPSLTLDASFFRLGCTPIVNLFDQIAQPIRMDQTQTEYQVVADSRREQTTEVYSINSVTLASPKWEGARRLHPFYSQKHEKGDEGTEAYWFASRRPSSKKNDLGTDMFLSIVDLTFHPRLPAEETITAYTTCTNRDLPHRLPISEEGEHFDIEGFKALRIRCLKKPTPAYRSHLQGGSQWQLISHLSLNYLSLAQGGVDPLREILRLYDFSQLDATKKLIDEGITHITSRRVVRRPQSMPWNGMCRGLEVTINFDEDKFVGSGVFLFASVLERFLGLYTSINSFTQFVATTQQREEPIRRWKPRAGEQILV